MSIRPHDDLELMSLRRLSDSLDATRTMLSQAQKIALETQEALLGLASEFCAQEIQTRQEKNEDLNLIPAAELAGMLRSRFKSLKLAASSASPERLAEANLALRELGAELESQRNRAEQAHQQIERLENQVRALERTLENERQAQRTVEAQSVPVQDESQSAIREINSFESWLAAWKSENRNWERDCNVISSIGQSGLSLTTELDQAIARDYNLSTRTARRAMLECVDSGLLEQETGTSIEGRPPQRYILTEKGRRLYYELTGLEPREPEHQELLKAHKSERHLALILKTADLFDRLGFIVEREPLRLEIEPKRYFLPDLVVKKDGETFYLEVETGDKVKASLNQKWENALAASGRICVVTDNLNTLRRVQGSIAQWSRFEGRSVTLYITCLVTLKSRSPEMSPWYAIKEYPPR